MLKNPKMCTDVVDDVARTYVLLEQTLDGKLVMPEPVRLVPREVEFHSGAAGNAAPDANHSWPTAGERIHEPPEGANSDAP